MTKKTEPKVTTKVIRGKLKIVKASVDGEPVVNIVKLEAQKIKGKAYITTDPTKESAMAVKKSARFHSSGTAALNRYRRITRRYPQITPRVKKLL